MQPLPWRTQPNPPFPAFLAFLDFLDFPALSLPNPALIRVSLTLQIREFFKGIIVLAGAISDGRAIRTAEVLGADFAYLGTRFIATRESMASDAYKQMLINYKDGPAPSFLPTVYTDKISGTLPAPAACTHDVERALTRNHDDGWVQACTPTFCARAWSAPAWTPTTRRATASARRTLDK